jgi:hypothetical protein
VIADVRGLRVAGYSDPFMRFRARHYQRPGNPRPTAGDQIDFANWLRPLVPRLDLVMVHEPAPRPMGIPEAADSGQRPARQYRDRSSVRIRLRRWSQPPLPHWRRGRNRWDRRHVGPTLTKPSRPEALRPR